MAAFAPIGEVLNGLEILTLDAGDVPIEAVVLIKVLDAEGEETWYGRYTDGLSSAEALGALLTATELELRSRCSMFRPTERDE